MPERPRIELEWAVHWCPVHLEPFRDRWPTGAGVAMLRLLDAAVADKAIAEHAGNQAESLDAVLREFSPLCCHIDAGELALVYAEAGIDPRRGLERTKRQQRRR